MRILKMLGVALSIVSLVISGCGGASQNTAQNAQGEADQQPTFIPYIPSQESAPPAVTDALPESPQDAPADLKLVYSVELWEMLLPRNSISTDEAFWKRVNENAIDLSPYTIMLKNGVRVGSLPIQELSVLQKLVDDRKASMTRIAGLAGKFIEIPVASNVPGQTIFYFNRSNQLIGRSYDRCDNLFYFSFESTPRQQEQIRLVLTPAVRGLQKKLQFSLVPGRLEREIEFKAEEVRYDASLNLDLPLSRVLVVAPSVEARDETSIGATFLLKDTPTEQLERLIVVIPRAFKRNDAQASVAP